MFSPTVTATPIPRTLALTLYGDLDLSVIDEVPPGRQVIKTKWLKPSQRASAYNFIKKQIAEGVLKPGQQLPGERTLQELLGVSRFTLREALARLSALGIVEITHGKGAFIAQEMNPASLENVFFPLFANQSMQHLIDFFEARMLIESEAVRLCAERRTKKDLEELKDILNGSEAALEDPLEFGELDFQFHKKISQAAGNIFIDKMMGCLNEYIKKYLQMLANNPDNRKRSLAKMPFSVPFSFLPDRARGHAPP